MQSIIASCFLNNNGSRDINYQRDIFDVLIYWYILIYDISLCQYLENCTKKRIIQRKGHFVEELQN